MSDFFDGQQSSIHTRGTSTNTLSVVALLQHSVNTADRELKTSLGRAGLGLGLSRAGLAALGARFSTLAYKDWVNIHFNGIIQKNCVPDMLVRKVCVFVDEVRLMQQALEIKRRRRVVVEREKVWWMPSAPGDFIARRVSSEPQTTNIIT
jgi:hypothetical protein